MCLMRKTGRTSLALDALAEVMEQYQNEPQARTGREQRRCRGLQHEPEWQAVAQHEERPWVM